MSKCGTCRYSVQKIEKVAKDWKRLKKWTIVSENAIKSNKIANFDHASMLNFKKVSKK